MLIGVGSYALNSEANSLVGQTLPIGLIVMGVFVLLLSALGGISAWRESIAGLATVRQHETRSPSMIGVRHMLESDPDFIVLTLAILFFCVCSSGLCST